ncbi:ion transporter [Reichenbachiella versicolor]|uniref:ion transporter n=1 Tax=Reichenbachiella versicolor TaxID=1821036 RepID=UPI000D6E88D7|nr:ion transporter [Reichenbachiella versicolor]
MENVEKENNKKFTFSFETLLLVLSIYVVIELYVGTIIKYTPEVQEILNWIDFGICLLFLYDFFTGIWKAEDKWKYLRVHWIDLVSSIPMVGVLRAGRIFRVIRILRVVRSAKYIFGFFTEQGSFNTFRNLIIISSLIIALFTISFYHVEKDVNPYINEVSDSLWWTTITTITVGFLQDIPPVSVEGKFLSVALILLGMIIFSTLTGTITDYFIEDEDIQDKISEVNEKVTRLEEKLDAITEKLDQLNNRS